jgi:uncharacterized protein (TIGR00369 family)
MGRGSTAVAPERARWPRLAAAPHPLLRGLLPRGYGGFTEATTPRHRVVPATTSVPLVVKLVDSPHRPSAFVMGARDSVTVLEGACARSYLEVLLAPLGAHRLLGLPMDELSGQLVDLAEVLGADGRRLADQLRQTQSWRHSFAPVDWFLLGSWRSRSAMPARRISSATSPVHRDHPDRLPGPGPSRRPGMAGTRSIPFKRRSPPLPTLAEAGPRYRQGGAMRGRSGPFWDGVQGRAPMPCAAATLGFEFIDADVDAGTIEVAFVATEVFTNPAGNALGAFQAAMLYDTVGPPCRRRWASSQFQSTLQLNVSFLRPVRPGRLIGKGRVVHRDGDLVFLEASLLDGEGAVIATATATEWPDGSHVESLLEISLQWLDGRTLLTLTQRGVPLRRRRTRIHRRLERVPGRARGQDPDTARDLSGRR